MPSTPFPAIRHDAGYPHHWGALSPLLDLTTGVFPVTKVDLEKDVVPADWKPISELDQKIMDFCEYDTSKMQAAITDIARRKTSKSRECADRAGSYRPSIGRGKGHSYARCDHEDRWSRLPMNNLCRHDHVVLSARQRLQRMHIDPNFD